MAHAISLAVSLWQDEAHSMDLAELEKIIKMLKAHEVTEFELQREGLSIKLSRLQGSSPATVSLAPNLELQPAIVGTGSGSAHLHVQPLPNAAAKEPQPDESFLRVESPIVGTFYRKPAPDAEPFVVEGDRVRKGQTLCIIEAMKLMNEIESPADGKIHKILLSDGHVVEYGEVLFLIEPN